MGPTNPFCLQNWLNNQETPHLPKLRYIHCDCGLTNEALVLFFLLV